MGRQSTAVELSRKGSLAAMDRPSRSPLRRKSSTADLDDVRGSMTLTDLFLSDLKGDTTREKKSSQQFLPLPPGLVSMMAAQKQHADSLKHDVDHHALMMQKKEEAKLELKLQDYWKTFATFPDTWPELELSRQRLQNFLEMMSAGVKEGLNRYCGETPKCLAFVVICAGTLALRSEPSMSSEHLTGEVLHSGQIVVADSVIARSKNKFLKVRGAQSNAAVEAGWVFERKGSVRCMAYVASVEVGLWWYRVVSQEYAEVRHSPSFSERVRSGFVLCPGEVCVVCLRCLVDDRCWMMLADGRGWIFEMRPPNAPRLISGTEDGFPEVVMAECTEDRVEPHVGEQQTGMQANAVEVGLWEYEAVGNVPAIGASLAGWVVPSGAKVVVDVRVPANGQRSKEKGAARRKPTVVNRIWLRLSDGRGWVPKTDLDGTALLKFVKMAAPGSGKFVVKKATSTEMDAPADTMAWMQGIA